MAFCYIRVEDHFFAILLHNAVRLIKLAPDLWVDGLWQDLPACPIHEGFTR